jgi:hypothetical protein
LFNICHRNSGLAFKSKNYFIAAQRFPKVTSETQVSFVNEAAGLQSAKIRLEG